VLGSVLDSMVGKDNPPEVRRDVGLLTLARLCANACYRFSAPFLAVIARGQGVSLESIGVALAASEVAGLLSPLNARLVDRLARRTALVAGLSGVAIGTTIAATSQSMVVFAIGLVVLAQSKMTFDLGLGSWVADHVPYERRSRVIGITETSWAFGLLIGVSAMGLITGLYGWRAGYALGVAAVVVMTSLVARRIPVEQHHSEITSRAKAAASLVDSGGAGATSTRLGAYGWLTVVSAFALFGSVMSLSVTFGSWFEDSFDFTPAMLSAYVFALGLGEFIASLTSAGRTDRWGKERSVAIGAAIMVPASIAMSLWHDTLLVGIVALTVAICCFEFAIVSSIAIGSSIVPGSPARGMALMMAGGTVGRAVAAIPATRLYKAHGMAWPALQAAALAAVASLTMLAARRFAHRRG